MTKTTILCADCKEETPLHDARYANHKQGRTKQVCAECWDRLIQENEELEERNHALADDRDKWKRKYEQASGITEVSE